MIEVQKSLQLISLLAEEYFLFFIFCFPVSYMQIHSNCFKTTRTYFASDSDPIRPNISTENSGVNLIFT